MKDIYKTYNFEAFLLDDDFVRVVNNPTSREEELLIIEQLSGAPHEDAKKAVAFLRAAKVDNQDVDTQSLWNRIQKDINNQKEMPISTAKIIGFRKYYKLIAGLAAVFLVLWMGNHYFYDTQKGNVIVATSLGEKIEELLPDGSIVTLNAGSQVEYSKQTFSNNRSIQLEGEAYFEVQKGASFVVNTQMGKVEVLGTSFNVYARSGILSVACTSGKVKVSNASKTFAKILLPGESIELDQDKETKSNFTQRHLWRKQKLEYSGADASTVIADIERQFDLKIELKSSNTMGLFSGVIPLQNLEDALESFTWPLRLKYKINGNKVEIY